MPVPWRRCASAARSTSGAFGNLPFWSVSRATSMYSILSLSVLSGAEVSGKVCRVGRVPVHTEDSGRDGEHGKATA